jgi:hypothetical protein
MATKLPEMAVILSVIVLGQRFSKNGNHTLGYLLLGIGMVVGIWWVHSIYSHSSKTGSVRKRVRQTRLDLTWFTASVLVTFVIYPWIVKPESQQSAQTIVIPALKVETSAPSPVPLPNAPPRQEATTSAPTIRPPAGPLGFVGTRNTIIRPSDSRGNTTTGLDQITLFFSQIGNTITVKPSGRIDSPSLAFFFDVDVSLSSYKLRTCMGCGNGRLNDSNGLPDKKTIWIFWVSPPFISGEPLSVTFSSATPAKLLKVTMGPRPAA